MLDLVLDAVKIRELRLAHVVEFDDVPAELAFDRCIGHFTLFQRGHRLAEFGDIIFGFGKIQVAAVFTGAWILGFGLGQVFKLGAALDLGDQRLGLVFVFDQDMPGAIFGAGGLGLELVVLGFGLGIGDRVLPQ